MEDDSDVPPLEDMSETFSNCLKIREEKKSKIQYKRNEVLDVPENAEKSQAERIEKLLGKNATQEIKKSDESEKDEVKKESSKEDTFCGFKKGFLTAAPKTKVKKPDEVKTIPVVKKKDIVNKNVLPEVQDAMNQQIPFLKSNDWITEDLLSKIAQNPRLFKRFTDPRFSEVLDLFQKDPQHVMKMCENNPEVKEFIQDFCAIMGDHFTKLGEKQEEEKRKPAASKKQPEDNEDEQKMKKILSDPEISSILKSPAIQRLLMTLKEEPHKAQKLLQSADTSMRLKIQKLVDVGLLQMAM